jgi:hypothetical protein
MARKLLLLGAAAIAAGVFLKRDKVAGLLPGRGETYEPPAPPHAPGPSNYDAPGPVANTATPVPAPDPQQPAAVDEDAEEAAAALEAANIGGVVSDYAGPADRPADEAERPLAEAGEGEAEGQEQAELDLEQAAQPTAPGMSDTERAIEDAIDQAANPLAGETIEPVRPAEEPRGDVEAIESPPQPAEPPAAEPEPDAWSPPVPEPADRPAPFEAGQPDPDESPTTEFEPPTATPPAPAESSETPESPESSETPESPESSETPESPESPETPAEEKKDGDDDGGSGSDWRTWSGRSINP